MLCCSCWSRWLFAAGHSNAVTAPLPLQAPCSDCQGGKGGPQTGIQGSQWCFPEISQPFPDPSQEANMKKKRFFLPNPTVDSQSNSHCFRNPYPICHRNRRAVNHHVQPHGFQLRPPALHGQILSQEKQSKCRNSYTRQLKML